MTPKEKAQYLFDNMYWYQNTNIWSNILKVDNAKQCALIAVDEILENSHTNVFTKYWQEVKQEIEKL
jgi:hypothetical protein